MFRSGLEGGLLMHPAAGLQTCLLGTRVDSTSRMPLHDLLMLGTAPDCPVSSAADGSTGMLCGLPSPDGWCG